MVSCANEADLQEREPDTLLNALLQALSTKGVGIQHALFVPPDSRYTNVTKPAAEDHVDLSWQMAVRNKWESLTKKGQAGGTKVLSLPILIFDRPLLPPTQIESPRNPLQHHGRTGQYLTGPEADVKFSNQQ